MKLQNRLQNSAFACLLASVHLIASGAEPATAPADKSGFTLFNPTPSALMRDFITDRPNATEGPYSVDAGHLQVEFSFAEYAHDQDHDVQTDEYSIMPTDFRLGVLNSVDVELILNPYENGHTRANNFSQRSGGFGDTQLRSTINLWGNDGGETAFGVIPFVTLPTGTDGFSDHHVEGGLILPLDVKLPYKFDLATEMEFDVNYNDQSGGYGIDLVHTISIGHDLFCDALNGYIEYVGVSPCDTGHSYLAYFDTGVTYAVCENVQLDVGINVGLSKQAGDFTLFTGLSFRL